MRDTAVPKSLRRWFVVHFAADMLFAIPLLVAPRFTLELFGWQTVDPVTTRLVAAALFGIGIQSLLGRNEPRAAFLGMLNLKIIWSMTAVLGFAIGLITGAPFGVWIFLGVFTAFSALWWYYRIALGRRPTTGG
jgi:hypothetical protein